jgi:hypothetical protein
LLSSGQALQVHALNVEQIEALAEALLDFTRVDDFEQWLAGQQH